MAGMKNYVKSLAFLAFTSQSGATNDPMSSVLQVIESELDRAPANDTRPEIEESDFLITDLGSGLGSGENETVASQPDFEYNVWVGCHTIPSFNGTYPRDQEGDETVCTDERMENTVCYVGSDKYLQCTCTRVTWMNMTMPTCSWVEVMRSTDDDTSSETEEPEDERDYEDEDVDVDFREDDRETVTTANRQLTGGDGSSSEDTTTAASAEPSSVAADPTTTTIATSTTSEVTLATPESTNPQTAASAMSYASPCGGLPAPLNGYLSCQASTCTLQCNAGYVPNSFQDISTNSTTLNAVQYCSSKSKMWSAAPFTSCVNINDFCGYNQSMFDDQIVYTKLRYVQTPSLTKMMLSLSCQNKYQVFEATRNTDEKFCCECSLKKGAYVCRRTRDNLDYGNCV